MFKYDVSKFSLILDPAPCVSIVSASLDPLPPPLICWRNTWSEGEVHEDLKNMFQMIKICFSIIIRNIYWGLGAVFSKISTWFRKKLIILLIISRISKQYVSTLCQLVDFFAQTPTPLKGVQTWCPKTTCPKTLCPKTICPKDYMPHWHYAPRHYAPRQYAPKTICPKDDMPQRKNAPKTICPKDEMPHKTTCPIRWYTPEDDK